MAVNPLATSFATAPLRDELPHYLWAKDYGSMRCVCKSFKTQADHLLQSCWDRIRAHPPEGLIDLKKEMRDIQQIMPDGSPWNRYKQLTKIFNQNGVITEQLPYTICGFEQRQLDAVAALEIARKKLEEFGDHTTKIGISNHEISVLPLGMNRFSSLQKLRIECCDLSSLPEALTTNLISLRLDGNRFEVLPPFIANLKKLKRIDFEDNLLSSISQLAGLTSLERINLFGNRIGQIGNEFAQMHHLTDLDIGCNALSTLSLDSSALSNLQYLSLAANYFPILPSCILTFTNLGFLNLANSVTRLPPEFSQLIHLTELDLSENQLTALPDPILHLSALQQLQLSGNLLHSLPSSLYLLSQLQTLDISCNRFFIFPDSAKDIPSLDLRGNPLMHCFDSTDNPVVNNLRNELKHVPTSPYAQLYLVLIQDMPLAEKIFSTFSEEDKNLIFEGFCKHSEHDLDWATQHTFDDKELLFLALRHAILRKYQKLGKDEQNQINLEIKHLGCECCSLAENIINFPQLADDVERILTSNDHRDKRFKESN